MHRLITTFVIFAVLLAALPAAAAPRVDTPQRKFDFGRIFQGDTVRHAFEFTNTGDATLNVDKVRTSCGCTAALVSSRAIAPGDGGKISVTFDSTRFRGNVKKTVYLYTDDPAQAVTTFTLQGTIEPEIAYRPDRLTLGPVAAGESVADTVTLTNQGSRIVGLEIARVSLAEMSAQLEKSDLQPSGSTQLQVKVTTKKGQKRLNGWVILETDSEATRQIRIPVLVSVR
ncbi:MAG: DUF1573 domain-containing protein [Desulfuromonadales bacterium]|nr:DUF1573 domain-containing protein [Desulfuromonadales bacterium]NIR33745.1 DUF1573 domain-containing protein [Desulfuromonadales bacterium]NIS43741.1 DUF1573 domain-containing protein [Desulfuromonadales bacterium]